MYILDEQQNVFRPWVNAI